MASSSWNKTRSGFNLMESLIARRNSFFFHHPCTSVVYSLPSVLVGVAAEPKSWCAGTTRTTVLRMINGQPSRKMRVIVWIGEIWMVLKAVSLGTMGKMEWNVPWKSTGYRTSVPPMDPMPLRFWSIPMDSSKWVKAFCGYLEAAEGSAAEIIEGQLPFSVLIGDRGKNGGFFAEDIFRQRNPKKAREFLSFSTTGAAFVYVSFLKKSPQGPVKMVINLVSDLYGWYSLQALFLCFFLCLFLFVSLSPRIFANPPFITFQSH